MENGQRKLLRVGIGLLKREFIFFCPDQLDCEPGATVVLGRAYGMDHGEALGYAQDTGQEVTESALRIATPEDLELIEAAVPTPGDANIFRRLADEHRLAMRLAGIDKTFDRSKVTFYYTAEGRVDFRELVKRLTREFQCRVELYQLNLEDQFKRFPACGICGLEVCCRKMSGLFGMKVPTRVCKDQKMSYNPVKMSGVCGKARCCYVFEHINYAEFAEALPKQGGRLNYRGHEFKLSDWDVFTRTVKLWSTEAMRELAVPWDEFKMHFRADTGEVTLSELFAASVRLTPAAPPAASSNAPDKPRRQYYADSGKESGSAREPAPKASRHYPREERGDAPPASGDSRLKKRVRPKPQIKSRFRRRPPGA